MCISSEVSFTLAATLGAAGGYCVRRAARDNRSLLPLAVIPLVFGVQQFCEGWVWTGVARGDPALTTTAATLYLFFALLFWPVWIPFSMLLLERSRRTRRALGAMTLLGAVLGLGLMVPLVVDPGWLAIQVSHHSLHYSIGQSPIFQVFPGTLWEGLYLLVVSTPLFVSSEKKMVHCGVAVIISASVTYVFFDHALASVWCLFAAALSVYLCVIFAQLPHRPRAERLGALG
jgi:hypothetical protein